MGINAAARPTNNMKESSGRQFGITIAYIAPGFIGLAGLAPFLPVVASWLRPVGGGELGLGPPLYAVMAAMVVGQVLSCFRWALVDRAHAWTGVTRPAWDDAQLQRVLDGFDYLVQNHYRYYEFTANSLLAVILAYGLNRWLGTLPFLGPVTDLAVVAVSAVLFAASRDALSKYYLRTSRLVGLAANKGQYKNQERHAHVQRQ